jgi:ABC-type multidrug transport system fused ATPase/permease subunit
VGNRRLLSGLIDTALILLRDSVAYFLLIRMLLSNTIELGDFVLTFAAVGTFSTWISGILEYGSSLNRGSDELGDIRVFFDLSNIPRSVNTFEMESTPPEIEFDNVSFTYPGNDAPTLSHVSFLIPAGERFALVGKNGAGKTTIVKLMTGLYTPSEGTVRIGGVDISTLDRSVLFPKMSAVFQDIHLLADSIATNVAQAQNVDLDAMWKALEMADFAEKVRSFPLQENTQLVIQVNSDAINLSGGEMQKLAIARALYHDAPVLILDEPTAALDPISEDQVYQKYALLTQGKTSLFISHRLASTRFCDRILLLDGSQIIEEGTHEELLAKNGAYAEMFSIQASYYQEREGDILA